MAQTAVPAAAAEHAASERRADWFELFFDLVFVVTVAVLSHQLHGDPTWRDYLRFGVLFFPAWWAWVNLMVSINLFGLDRQWNRLMLVVAMPGLGLMAAAAPEALERRAWAFALGAAWTRLAIFGLWAAAIRRSPLEIPLWRPVSYAAATGGLWVASIFVPSPWRFAVWAAAIAIEIALLAYQRGTGEDVYRSLAVGHLVERIGLFVVIVLGEGVFTVVTGLEEHFIRPAAIAALSAFVVSAVLAMSFFRWSTGAAERALGAAQSEGARSMLRDAVMYLPFLMISGLSVLAAALGTAVAEPSHTLPMGSRWGLAIGVASFYVSNALISMRLGQPLRAMLRWLVPAVALSFLVVLPLAYRLPAWGAVTVAALVVLGIFLRSLRAERRALAT